MNQQELTLGGRVGCGHLFYTELNKVLQKFCNSMAWKTVSCFPWATWTEGCRAWEKWFISLGGNVLFILTDGKKKTTEDLSLTFCLIFFFSCIKNLQFGASPVVPRGSESSCQCRGHEFEPWSGRIPHAVEHLSPWATTTEPSCHNHQGLQAWGPCSATREATAISPRTATKSSPRSLQIEKAPRAATKIQCSQK